MTTSDEITKRFVTAYYKLYGLREIKTKKEFCKSVDSAPSNFKCMEDGTRNATVDNICRLIDIYHVCPDWLFLERGEFIDKKI
jgi:hypothetical protein